MRISDMNETQYATYLRGVDDGEHNAINACYGGRRSAPIFRLDRITQRIDYGAFSRLIENGNGLSH